MDVEEFHFTQATDLQDLSGTPGSREYQLSRSVLEQPTEPRLAALWRFPRLTFPTRWTGSKSMARRKASMRCTDAGRSWDRRPLSGSYRHRPQKSLPYAARSR